MSASNVALTMLCGLLEPRHLVKTFCIPAASTTARTPPPAITPVPSDAGLRMTYPAPIPANHLEGDGSFHDRNANQVFLGLLQALSYRFRHFVRFAHSVTDNGVAITHHDQRAEAESPAALDDFGHPADVNHFLLKLQTLRINPFQREPRFMMLLKLQSAFTSTIGNGLDSPMKEKPVAIEDNAA